METKKEKIIPKAIELLKSNPNGIQQKELIRQIKRKLPNISATTIRDYIWNIDEQFPSEIYKPTRGIFCYRGFKKIKPTERVQEKITAKERIIFKAIEIIKSTPNGIQLRELVGQIKRELSDIPATTIRSNVWDLDRKFPEEILKKKGGHFYYNKFKATEKYKKYEEIYPEGRKEENFYQPFADWLITGEEKCTQAVPVGGKEFGFKWGTPDVIGFTSNLEIVSAEIKINTQDVITAFGQACSYKYFSHKSFLVIPRLSLSEMEVRRQLETLCNILGIGLVYFDSSNPKVPKFRIKVKAIKHEQEPNKDMVDSIIEAYFKE